MDQEQIVLNIKKKITEANSILILGSTPVDYDSMGTALTIKWWLETYLKKNSQIYIFANIPENAKTFPGFEAVQQIHPEKVDFQDYDLIITVDGNTFRQFFTSKHKDFLLQIPKEKLINIDHHQRGEWEDYIPDSTLRYSDSSTAKVFYDSFVKPSGVDITAEVATWLYMALVGDTGIFTYEIYSDTFAFAQMLLDKGVDHYRASNFTVSKDMMDFTIWAIEKTDYYPEIQTTILTIDENRREELTTKFNKNWESYDLARYYQKVFMHTVEGYPYGIIFKVGNKDSNTRVIWRSRAVDSDVEIMQVLRNIGFKANGHRNAGGGLSEDNIAKCVEKFQYEMRKHFA